MKHTAYIVPGLMALGLVAFAPSALALSTTLEAEGTVVVQSPVNDDDMIYVGPGDDTPVANTKLTASVTRGAAPLSVSFTGLGLNADATYIIDFGDGSNSGPLTASGRCPQMTYPSSPDCIGVAASHTYAANGTYTATLQPYAACMWSDPRCLMAAQLLGEVTIVVGDGQNDQEPVNDDNMTYEGEVTAGVNEDGSNAEAGEGQNGFFSSMWNGVVTFFVGNPNSADDNTADSAVTGEVTGSADVNTEADGESLNADANARASVEAENRGFFQAIFYGFLNLF